MDNPEKLAKLGTRYSYWKHYSCSVRYSEILGLFVFVLCLVYPMLLVSLYYPFLIAPSVFSNVYVLLHAA